ncbi:MAG: PAS-domain containing protein [Tateyamaria sp.]
MTVLDVLVVFGSAFCAVAAGLVFLARSNGAGIYPPDPVTEGVSFLFHGVDLQHASPDAHQILDTDLRQTDWQSLVAGLSARFPGLPDVRGLAAIDTLSLRAAHSSDSAVLRLDRENDVTRVTIEAETSQDAPAVHQLKSLEAELDILRLGATAAPYPIWLTDGSMTVIWCNEAYQALSTEMRDADKDCGTVFDFTPTDFTGGKSVRVPVRKHHSNATQWFNVTATRSGALTVFHAVDIDAVIQAEVAQRNFVQTLAKTFAQLSIGLAIFDRNSQLALFNPALVDLTSLPAEFLSGRPDMLSFFDRLRDNRVMPEPKNYGSWRQEISEMINAASHGSYQETWTLDTGHTYRVSGRPHPDGAVAFLIEDITAEVSLTRNFRAELELGQSLMDTFEDALVVFSSAGVLTFCNAAYRDMWKLDPDNSFADVTIVDSLQAWQEQCAPDPAWGDIRDFVMKLGERASWDAQVKHHQTGTLHIQISPIASGATVIRFAEPDVQSVPSKQPTL